MGADDHQEIVSAGPVVAVPSKSLADSSLDSLASDRVADPATDRQSDAEVFESVGKTVHQEGAGFTSHPGGMDLGESPSSTQAPASPEVLSLCGRFAHESSRADWYSRINRVRVRSPITRPPSVLVSTGRLAAS